MNEIGLLKQILDAMFRIEEQRKRDSASIIRALREIETRLANLQQGR